MTSSPMLTLSIAALALAACPSPPPSPDASDGSVDAGIDAPPEDVNIDCVGEFRPRPADAGAPLFSEVQVFFGRRCTAGATCHGMAGGQAGLVLEGPGVYDALRTASTEAPFLSRVTPGDPDRSYMWLKLDGCFAQLHFCQQNVIQCGVQMPMTSPISEGFRLDEAAILYDWIRAGAPQN